MFVAAIAFPARAVTNYQLTNDTVYTYNVFLFSSNSPGNYSFYFIGAMTNNQILITNAANFTGTTNNGIAFSPTNNTLGRLTARGVLHTGTGWIGDKFSYCLSNYYQLAVVPRIAAAGAPGFPSSGGSLNANAPGQKQFITTNLYFAPSNSVYSNFVWTGSIYTNPSLKWFIRLNTTSNRWEFFTNTVLVATNPTVTNVWRGTNGIFKGTSYWAQVSGNTTNVPGKKTSGAGLSTNLPIRAFYITTNHIPVQSTDLLVASGFSLTGVNGNYIYKAGLPYIDDNTDPLSGGFTNQNWTALNNPNPGFSDGTYFLFGPDQSQFYICASTNDIEAANTFAASATLIGTNNWGAGTVVRYGFITNLTYTTNYYH